jgi:type I restriction enzyme S subunit
MSNNFEHKPLSQLCTLLNGLAFKPEDWSENGHPIIRIQNLNGSSDFNFCNRSVPDEYMILPDTVLFSWSGNRGTSFGPYWWKGPHGVLNQHIFKVTPKSGIYPRWLYYGLDFARQKAEQEAHGGSGLVHVRRTDLLAYQIPAPPLPEQRRIAEILDTIDEAIQKTEALISKLKAMKQGLLHALLTRGLDKNGKLRDPKAHPERFKDSPLGMIPREWVIQELGKAAPKIQDGTHFSPKTTRGPFRYLTSKNIRFGYVDLSDCGWISKKEHEAIYSRCDVRYGDVLLTKDGANTGNAAINNLNEPVSLLSSVAFIRCDDRTLHSEYVFHYLLSPGCQQRIKDLMSGNAITRLTLERIKSFVIPVPDIKEQLKIIEPLNSHDARIRIEEQYRDKLKLQKKGLMHDLLTGKVRVKV